MPSPSASAMTDASTSPPDRAPHHPTRIATPGNAQEFSNSPWTQGPDGLLFLPTTRMQERCCESNPPDSGGGLLVAPAAESARLVSSVAIVLVALFTSTSSQRDQVCEPYTY